MRSIYIPHTHTHIRSQLHHAIVLTACSAMQSFRIHAASIIICHMRLHTMTMRIHNREINLYTTHTHTHIRSQLDHAIVFTACSAMQSFRIHAASIIICHMRLHTMHMRIHNREINLYTTHTYTHSFTARPCDRIDSVLINAIISNTCCVDNNMPYALAHDAHADPQS